MTRRMGWFDKYVGRLDAKTRAAPTQKPSPLVASASMVARSRSARPILFQVSIPHRDDLRPGGFGRFRLVNVALGKLEAMPAALIGVDGVARARLVEGGAQGRDHRFGNMLVDLGEGVIHLALDAIDQEMGRVLGLGHDPDAIERG